MAQPISNEKRAAIVRHMQANENKEDIAKWLFICVRTVTRVWNKFKALGTYEAEPRNSGRKPMVREETMKLVVAKIGEAPDMTLLELIEEFQLPISESALCKRLIKLGLTYKKRHSIPKHNNGKTLSNPVMNGEITKRK